VKGPDIPLMPLVLKVHFLSCLSGEGISHLRKTLYKEGGAGHCVRKVSMNAVVCRNWPC